MSRQFIALATCSSLLALSGCAAQAPTPPPIDGETALLGPPQIKALYGEPHREDGVVLDGSHAGKHWTKWIGPDGTLRLSAAHGMFRDTGHVKVDGDEVCSTWNTIDKGKTACMRLSKVAPDAYVALDNRGVEVSRFRVSVPGKPPGPLD